MKIKIIATILIIGVGSTVSYLIVKNLLSNKNLTPVSVKNAENNLVEEGTQKLLNKAPLQWVKETPETLGEGEGTIKSPLENQSSQSQTFPDIGSKIQNFINSLSNPGETEAAKIALAGDYYKTFADALVKVNFTSEELKSLEKDQNGRVLLLEELMEQAISGTDLKNFKNSFLIWHQLDERVLAALNKISVKSEELYLHQPMIDWFKYHSEIAEKFSEGNLSQNQINQLFGEFKIQAEIHNSKFGQSVSQLKKSPDFVLIPMAQAITCGAVVPPPFYHFGGRVVLMEPCDFGIVETISPPCGGLILFSYPILAANPFLWKKPTIGSAVLGRSILVPGVCPLGVCPACVLFPYEAIALYFGTSLTP